LQLSECDPVVGLDVARMAAQFIGNLVELG
jgi:hypothetical protein